MNNYSVKAVLKARHDENLTLINILHNNNVNLFDNEGNLKEWVYEFSCPYHKYEETQDNVDEILRISNIHNRVLKEKLYTILYNNQTTTTINTEHLELYEDLFE